ncbi:hypothetical protein [Ekhidna sp. To15]|uniref:hypothetical protein n=1 Tax=Ekhidna sp. To15 TaxID=3395267 RepID=UPI003F51C2CE
MKREHLHHFITEEIYILPQDENIAEHLQSQAIEEEVESTNNSPIDKSEQKVEKQVVEELEQKPKKQEVVESEETPAHIETKQESPEIPHHDLEDAGEISFAVFHNSHDASDIELLHKIIDACKLPHDQYKIFGGGFDQSVHFKKALVFVPEAKAFYTPIPYKNSMFLCSKPLDQISGDVQEKAKLWGALQKFV